MDKPKYEFMTVKVPKGRPKWTGGLDHRGRDQVLAMYGAQGWEFVRKVRELWGHSEEVELRRALPSGDVTPAGRSPGPSTADELTKLADLLDRELITRDEFDRQKQRILESSAESSHPGKALTYTLVLDDPGDSRIRIIQQIRQLTGKDLKSAHDLVVSTPSTLLSGIDHGTATHIQGTLVRFGASVRIVPVKLCGAADDQMDWAKGDFAHEARPKIG